MYELIDHFRASRWLYIFICLHLLLWTVIPIIVRFNLPMDSIEGTIWGQQLEWGYDKNPFMNGWLTALAIYLDHHSGWMIYLFSQITVGIAFFAVWLLAKRMMPQVYALIAVMLLEGIQYYNFHAIDFNDNTLELGLWGFTIYFFYRALQISESCSARKVMLFWILTGAFAGLGMMAKYYTLALLTPMFLFLILNPLYRRQLKTLPPYLGLLTFLLIILPHTLWLFFHDFVTITYVFERTDAKPSWLNHIRFPLQFAYEQLQVFFPALLFFLLLFIGRKPLFVEFKQRKIDQSFLFYVGLGPFVLTLFLALFFGIKLRAGWGMPLLSLWSVILLSIAKPNISLKKMHHFLCGIFALMGLLLIGYSISLLYARSPTSANFPGKQIARVLTDEWHHTYHTPLNYVAGSRWIAGNIEFYSPDHPAVFMEWNKRRSPWIDTTRLQEKGAIFVWDIDHHEAIPDEIAQEFPQLEKSTVKEFTWFRNKNLPPIKIGVAFLPPKPLILHKRMQSSQHDPSSYFSETSVK